MFSRHGQALLGTVRHYAPAPVCADPSAALNLAPWESMLTVYDLPVYAIGTAASGALPALTYGPAPSGTLPFFGIPGAPAPSIVGGVVTPGVALSMPDSYIYEDNTGQLIVGAYTTNRVNFWALEVRDSSGALVRTVTEHWDGRATFNADSAPELEFSTTTAIFGDIEALDAPELFTLAGTYEIWLRDWRGFLMGRFEITDAKFISSAPAHYLTVHCVGLEARLTGEPLDVYSTPVETQTNEDGTTTETREAAPVAAIVEALLAKQQRTPALKIGKIDDAIGSLNRVFRVEDTTIWQALRFLQATLPRDIAGVMWIDANYRLQWRASRGLIGQTLSTNEDAPALLAASIRAGFDEICTRLYLYGQNQSTDTSLTLKDAGLPYEYMDRNTGTYGVRAQRRTDNNIVYPETLANIASRILDETSVPYFEAEISVVDLAKADGGLYTMPDIWPGVSYALDITAAQAMGGATVKAQSVVYDLSNPLGLQVKLQSRAERLSDIFDRILSQLNPKTPTDRLLDSLAEEWQDEIAEAVADAMHDEGVPSDDLRDAMRDFLDGDTPDYYEPMPDERPGDTVADVLKDWSVKIAPTPDDPLPVNWKEAKPGDGPVFARDDHEHRGVPIETQETDDAPSGTVPETPCLLFTIDQDGGPRKLYTPLWDADTSAYKWVCLSHLDEEEEEE